MTELSARVDDGWAPPLTPAERAAIETDREVGLHLSSRREHCDCEVCLTVLPTLWNKVRRYLAAAAPHIAAEERLRLAEEGSLLPAGSERSTRFHILWCWPDGHCDEEEPDSLEDMRELLAGPWPINNGIEAEHYEATYQETWSSQLTPVPIEVLAG